MPYSLWTLLFGKSEGCVCPAPEDHQAGRCPNDCLCERCACTCTAMCSLGGRVDQRYGGCGCGCIHHHKGR